MRGDSFSSLYSILHSAPKTRVERVDLRSARNHGFYLRTPMFSHRECCQSGLGT